MRIVIKNANMISPNPLAGDILIDNGLIVAIAPQIDAPDAQIIDATGLVALPGLIDMHVHLRDPGQTHKEDIFSGCAAAAAGGVTAVACMPNTTPTVDSPEWVETIIRKSAGAKERVYPVAAITQALEGKNLTDFAALKAAGAVGVSDDGRPVEDLYTMREALKQAHKNGLFVTSHCEVLKLVSGGIMHEGTVSRQLGVKGIPAAAEEQATAREIALARELDLPVHIAHVSTGGSCELIRQAKAQGVAVSCETAPHYFTLTESALLGRDANYRMNPPLRTEADRQAILHALCDGTIDAIATDHAPHAPHEKADFEHAFNGVIGLETSLAASYTALVHSGLVDIMKLTALMSATPAKLLGVSGGVLQAGGVADICLFDPAERWVVDKRKLHSKSSNTPFAGVEFCGKVKYTLCRGKITYQFDL